LCLPNLCIALIDIFKTLVSPCPVEKKNSKEKVVDIKTGKRVYGSNNQRPKIFLQKRISVLALLSFTKLKIRNQSKALSFLQFTMVFFF